MTMHMIKGIYAPASKPKKIDLAQMEKDWRQHSKDMRKQNMPCLQFNTLQDYIAFRTGKVKSKKKAFEAYVPQKSETVYKNHYPSHTSPNDSAGGLLKEKPVYSGDYMVGIATMHKSNLVPVGRGDNPTDYATMRRS
jgi:hypothetical protein